MLSFWGNLWKNTICKCISTHVSNNSYSVWCIHPLPYILIQNCLKLEQVTVEKNELREENSTLGTQIGKLQSEIEARVVQSKPDLNAPPPDCLTMPAPEPTLGQAHTVLVLPFHSDLQAYPLSDAAQVTSNPTSNVSKPHARYPTLGDSWPAQLLRQQPEAEEDSAKVCNSSNR